MYSFGNKELVVRYHSERIKSLILFYYMTFDIFRLTVLLGR